MHADMCSITGGVMSTHPLSIVGLTLLPTGFWHVITLELSVFTVSLFLCRTHSQHTLSKLRGKSCSEAPEILTEPVKKRLLFMTGGTWLRRSQPIGEQQRVHLSRVAACEMTWKTETAEAPVSPPQSLIKWLYVMIITLLSVGGVAISTVSVHVKDLARACIDLRNIDLMLKCMRC